MKIHKSLLLCFILCFFVTGRSAAQEPIREGGREDLLRQLQELRRSLDSLKVIRSEKADDADAMLELLEERLEKRFTELENKISAIARSTAPVVFNPRTTAFINFAARTDSKTAFNADGSVEINDRPFLRSVEIDFRAPVDPYAEAVAILSLEDEAGTGFAIDPEEVYGLLKQLPILESAPLGLKVKIGKFRAPFGVNNRLHLHDIPWITRPLSVARFLGSEHGEFFESGFNPIGADFDFFLPSPIPGTTLEMNIDVVKSGDLGLSQGEAGKQPAGLAHVTLSADWKNEHIFVLGGSAYRETGLPSTELFGLDVTYKWAPSEERTSRSVVLGGEALFGRRSFIDSLQGQITIRPRGWYAYAQIQLSYWLYCGARYDWVEEPAAQGVTTRSIGAYASYYTTEFLRFRIGYEHRSSGDPVLNGLRSGFFEVNFVFGSHPTEPYWVNR